MSFTYDLDEDVGKVRLRIGDTTEGAGVKPDNTNLSDEEIESLLEDEEDHVMRTVAACCEMLALAWAGMADIVVGPRHESLSKVAERYAERAKSLREQYGGGGAGAFSVTPLREDGYSEYATTGGDEVAFGPEYS